MKGIRRDTDERNEGGEKIEGRDVTFGQLSPPPTYEALKVIYLELPMMMGMINSY